MGIQQLLDTGEEELVLVVLIDSNDMGSIRQDRIDLTWVAWHVSGVALELTVATDPPFAQSLGAAKDLPEPTLR